MPINIHGKEYWTVAERVAEAHKSLKDGFSIETELIESNDKYVLFKATVFIGEESFNGYATSTFSKGAMEAKNPFEVAETSAVGRALGFAGFGMVDSVASADEVKEATSREENLEVTAKSEDYKYLYSLAVKAETIDQLNSIINDPKFKTLHLEEKRLIQDRVKRAVLKGVEGSNNG